LWKSVRTGNYEQWASARSHTSRTPIPWLSPTLVETYNVCPAASINIILPGIKKHHVSQVQNLTMYRIYCSRAASGKRGEKQFVLRVYVVQFLHALKQKHRILSGVKVTNAGNILPRVWWQTYTSVDLRRRNNNWARAGIRSDLPEQWVFNKCVSDCNKGINVLPSTLRPVTVCFNRADEQLSADFGHFWRLYYQVSTPLKPGNVGPFHASCTVWYPALKNLTGNLFNKWIISVRNFTSPANRRKRDLSRLLRITPSSAWGFPDSAALQRAQHSL